VLRVWNRTSAAFRCSMTYGRAREDPKGLAHEDVRVHQHLGASPQARSTRLAAPGDLAILDSRPLIVSEPAVHEPVSASSRTGLRVSKTEIEKGDQRRAAETYRLGAGSSPFVRQETWVTGPNLRKCRGSYTASPRDDSNRSLSIGGTIRTSTWRDQNSLL
jgi:hypothetical protein